MQVQETIDELRMSVERTASGHELLEIIVIRLSALRQTFRSHRSAFTPGDIEFLKGLSRLSDHLRELGELKEEAVDVGSVKEYEDLLIRLNRSRDALAGLPVGKSVTKAIRELGDKLPAIQAIDEANRQFRVGGRIDTLEQNSRLCGLGHVMVIRTGNRGDFWGCSHYPLCWETAQLTHGQRDLLARARG